MLDVLEAERLKLARHRAAWFLLWIYPIGLTLLFLVALTWELSRGQPPSIPRVPETAASWIGETAATWRAPTSTFGRYLIAAFAAVAFAGEYVWNTWKLIVPHRGRVTLMAAKYLTVLGLLYAAFVLTGLLAVVLSWAGSMATGHPLPEGITAAAIAGTHAEAALAAGPAILLTVAYTSLAAVVTRSTIAALIIGVVVGTAEGVFGKFAPIFSVLAPDLVSALYHGLPGYHLENLRSWMESGRALRVPFPDHAVALPWGVSLAALAAWIGGMIALTVGLFQRQDLN